MDPSISHRLEHVINNCERPRYKTNSDIFVIVFRFNFC